jgi:TonB family protein
VFTLVDKVPEYEGGSNDLLRYINENTDYPMEAKIKNISGRVIVSFIIMKDGTICGFEVIKKVHNLLDMEALDVVKSLPEKWKPAEINGEKVNSIASVPVTFTLK